MPKGLRIATASVVLLLAVAIMAVAAWQAEAGKLASWGDMILGALLGRMWSSIDPGPQGTP